MPKKSEQPAASKSPSYIAYHIRNNGEEAAYWTRIGAAWANADGKGINLQLETMPFDGRITLRVPSEDK